MNDHREVYRIIEELRRNGAEAGVITAHVPGGVFDRWAERLEAATFGGDPFEMCDEWIHTWDVFRPEQIDSYWMHCDLLGPHDVHHNRETGATWRTLPTGRIERCVWCSKTFTPSWSDEEASAEFKKRFPDADTDAIEIVCDDCYRTEFEEAGGGAP